MVDKTNQGQGSEPLEGAPGGSDGERYLLSLERIATLYPHMTGVEKAALGEWERAHVRGDGRVLTSDWPGWRAVIERLSH